MTRFLTASVYGGISLMYTDVVLMSDQVKHLEDRCQTKMGDFA